MIATKEERMEQTYRIDELRQAAADLHLSGYLARIVLVSAPDTRLQAIADAYKGWKDASAHPIDDVHVAFMRDALDALLDVLTV